MVVDLINADLKTDENNNQNIIIIKCKNAKVVLKYQLLRYTGFV